MGKPRQCPTGYLALKRGCGHQQAVAMTCKSPLCPTCEKERAIRVQKRWTATLKTLPGLKLMTLTITNGQDLAERLTALDSAFRSLLDFRIGRNNRALIKRTVTEKVGVLQDQGTIDEQTAQQWIASTEKWLNMAKRQEAKRGKSVKLRKLLRGLSSLEITYNPATSSWHAHRHVIISMPYMPQIVLSELWNIATGGNGNIVDIRAITDVESGVTEAIKYTTKAWEIPEEKQEELLNALHGKKRIKAIGKIKPQKQPKKCAGCDQEDCTCKRIATVGMSDQNESGGFDIPNPAPAQKGMQLVIYRDNKNRLSWRIEERPLSLLSLYRAKYQEKEANQHSNDPPQPQRVFRSPDLTITFPQIEPQMAKAKQLINVSL